MKYLSKIKICKIIIIIAIILKFLIKVLLKMLMQTNNKITIINN